MLRDTRRSSKPEYRAQYPDARPFHFPQLNLVCRQRPRTVEVMIGCRVQCAGESSSERSLKVRRLLREQEKAGALPAALTILTRREIPVPARTLTGRCGGSTPPSCRGPSERALGLQALQRCSGLLNRRARGSTVATHHFYAGVAQQRQQQFRKLPGKSAPRECESPRRPHLLALR